MDVSTKNSWNAVGNMLEWNLRGKGNFGSISSRACLNANSCSCTLLQTLAEVCFLLNELKMSLKLSKKFGTRLSVYSC